MEKTEKRISSKYKIIISVLVVSVFLAGLFLIPDPDGSSEAVKTKKISAQADDCELRVMIMLDRSSSVSIPRYGGNPNNPAAVKNAANALVQKIYDSVKDDNDIRAYTQVYAFGSAPVKINANYAWHNLKGTHSPSGARNVDLQKLAIGSINFKNNTTSNEYPDGINGQGEGLTNWESSFFEAIRMERSTRAGSLPTHLIFFTDGNPTVRNDHMIRAQNAGGSFSAAGLPNVDGDSDGNDLRTALKAAADLRKLGTRIVPIGIGNVNKTNLENIAGWAYWGVRNPHYMVANNNYARLIDAFEDSVELMRSTCGTPPEECIPPGANNECPETPPTSVSPGLQLSVNPPNVTIKEGETANLSMQVKNDSNGDLALKDVNLTYYYGNVSCPTDYGDIDEPDPDQPGLYSVDLAPGVWSQALTFSQKFDVGSPNDVVTYTVCAIGRANLSADQVLVNDIDTASARTTFTITIEREMMPS